MTLEPPFHDALPDPDDEGALHVYIQAPAPCPSCGERFEMRLQVGFLELLARAGVSEAEAMDRVIGALAARRIVCPQCEVTRQN